MVLTVVYDNKSLNNYNGPIAMDPYGRKMPKPAHGSINLPSYTNSISIINEYILKLFHRITDKNLMVRRIYVVANHLLYEDEYDEEDKVVQLDLFSNYDEEVKKDKKRKKRLAKEKDMQKNTYYLDIADSHAQTTIKNHYRPNYSTWHVIDYDPETGDILHRNTAQGFSDDSDWARGQAWGLYGYTMMYRETGNKLYLKQAKKVAKYLFSRTNMPEDLVPYWDYDCPDIPNTVRDASSAAIMASALIELSTLDKSCRKWRKVAEKQLRSLSSSAYRSQLGTNHGFILMHSTGSKPGNSEVDVPLSYADYYYVEALMRLKKLLK